MTISSPGLSISEMSCGRDRKSTRLNSSHSQISYAVFCLKKKKKHDDDDLDSVKTNLSILDEDMPRINMDEAIEMIVVELLHLSIVQLVKLSIVSYEADAN